LWALAWDGLATTDGFAAVRAGLASRFAPAEPHPGPAAHALHPPHAGTTPFPSPAGRLRFGTWRATRAFGGLWSPLFPPDAPADALERDELDRGRARVLLQRCGVVFRELTARELPFLSWGRLFRALRLLELSGEAVAGQFFEGIHGAQFALPEALDALQRGEGAEASFFLSAADPAAPTGLGLAALPEGLPRRVPGSHAAFVGGRLVAASERRGRALALFAPPADQAARAVVLDLLRFLAGQRVARPAVVVESINGEPAADGAWGAALAEAFHATRDAGALRLVRKA
jgi:ATP-dependent Lhr-like helicase